MAPVPISQIDRGSVPDVNYAVDKQFGFLPCAVGGLGGKLIDRSSCDTKDTKVDPCHLPRLSITIPAADVQWEEEDEEAGTPTTASTPPGSVMQEDTDEEEIEEANTRVKAARNVASFAKMRQRRGRQREYSSCLQFRKDIIGPKPMMVRSLPMDAGPLPILAFPVSVPSRSERPQPYIDVDQASSWATPAPRSPLHRSSTTEEIQEIAAAFASKKRMSW